MYYALQHINSFIARVILILLFFAFSIIIISCFTQIVTRLLEISAVWTEETARYMAVWMTFLGVAYAFRHKTMIAVEILSDRIDGNSRKILSIFILILSLIFCIVLTIFGFILVLKISGQISPVLHVPMALVYSGLPTAGLLMVLFSIEDIIKWIKILKEKVVN